MPRPGVVGRGVRTFISGSRRDGGGGTSDGGKVDACLVIELEGKSWDVDGTRSATALTVLESTLADLSSGSEVFLRSYAGASGKLKFVSGLF